MSGSATLLGLSMLCYLLGAVSLGANLFLRRPWLLAAGRTFAVLAALLHGGAIGLRCVEVRHAPFTTPAESLSLLAWIVCLLYLGMEALWRLSAAGPFALGLSFLLVLIGAGLSGAGGPPGSQYAELLAERAISLHILATVAAIGAFALAFSCAALYLTQHHILKSKNGLAWVKRLPPLATVESAGFLLVAIGFPLLTLGILSGLVRAGEGGLPPGWQTDGKTLLAFVVWGVYAAYLVARLGLNWPPVRTAYILIAGLALSLLLFLVPSAAHQFAR
jgi:ABC-type uncharacterized transport system, permease component